MNLTTDQIRTFPIPVPDLPTQRAIVAEIKAEQARGRRQPRADPSDGGQDQGRD